MDNKSPECFACEPRARGVRLDFSLQKSIVLPHEHFVCAEFTVGEVTDSLKMIFVSHEIIITGHLLRRIETAILNRDLSWVSAQPEKFYSRNTDRPFVTRLAVRVLEQPASETEK